MAQQITQLFDTVGASEHHRLISARWPNADDSEAPVLPSDTGGNTGAAGAGAGAAGGAGGAAGAGAAGDVDDGLADDPAADLGTVVRPLGAGQSFPQWFPLTSPRYTVPYFAYYKGGTLAERFSHRRSVAAYSYNEGGCNCRLGFDASTVSKSNISQWHDQSSEPVLHLQVRKTASFLSAFPMFVPSLSW